MDDKVPEIIARLRDRMADNKRFGVRATGVWDKDLEVLMAAAERIAELEAERDEWQSRAECSYGKGSDGEVYARSSMLDAMKEIECHRERIAELEKALADETEACAKVAFATADELRTANSWQTDATFRRAMVDRANGALAAAERIRARTALASAQSSTTGASHE